MTPTIDRIRDTALTSDVACRPRAADSDETQAGTVSNENACATLSGSWKGARAAVTTHREPRTTTFTLPVSFPRNCRASGQRSHQSTLTGTDAAGTGSATVTLTAVLVNCAFDHRTRFPTVSATAVSIAGTITISSVT